MLISRTPYRISLFGGTTDYEEYYSKHGSTLIGFAINKYSYLAGRRTPAILPYKSRFSYSQTEIIEKDDCSFQDYLRKIKHNGIRGVLEYLDTSYPLEISHFCDIPSQTGLGSSSSFVVGLLELVHALEGHTPSKKRLAKQAIYVERKLLNECGGIQDQIWAAYGGINSIHINNNGNFNVKPLPISTEFIDSFLSCSILVYTGNQRDSFKIANHSSSSECIKKDIHDICNEAYTYFCEEDIEKIAKLLSTSWDLKKRINKDITTDEVNDLYNYLKSQGMIGGKLLGAGNSGFIFGVFPHCGCKDILDSKIKERIVNFDIDYDGSKIIYE